MEKRELRILVKSLVIENLLKIENMRHEMSSIVPKEVMFVDVYTKFKYISTNMHKIIEEAFDTFDKALEESEVVDVNTIGYEAIQGMFCARFSHIFSFLLNLHLGILAIGKCIEKEYIYDSNYTKWCDNLSKGTNIMETKIEVEFKDKYFGSTRTVERNLDEIIDTVFKSNDIKDNIFRECLLNMIDKIFQLGESESDNMIGRFILEYLEVAPTMHLRMKTADVEVIRNLMCTGDRETFEKVFTTYSMAFLSDKTYRKYGPAIDEIITNLSYDQDMFCKVFELLAGDQLDHLRDGELTYTTDKLTEAFKEGILNIIFNMVYLKVDNKLVEKGFEALPLDKIDTKIRTTKRNTLTYLVGQSQMYVKSIIDYVCSSSHNQYINITDNIQGVVTSLNNMALDLDRQANGPVAKKTVLKN